MVILHVKRSDLNQFLYESNTSISCDDLLDQLVRSKQILFILWKISYSKSSFIPFLIFQNAPKTFYRQKSQNFLFMKYQHF